MKSVLVVIACAAVASSEAGVTFRDISIPDAPFEMPVLRECVFPARDFSIADYGARLDGTKCTAAFAAAMAACEAAGGGRVVVPKGTWLTGAVRFRSNCNLHLEEGAVLEFTDDPADYPKVQTTWEGVECLNHSPLLFAYEVENVAITGSGLIRPRMKFWRTWFARPPAHMYATEQLYHWCSTNAPMASRDLMAIEGSNVRPHLIQFNRCRNVLMDGVRIRESPFWMIHLYHSENCIIRNLKTYAHGHNNDGVDVDMTQNVLIEKCSFDQGDDGIVLKAGRNADAWRLNRPTMNVVVRDCDLHASHSLLGIGSELSGGVKNVWMTRCRADATFCAFKIKTNPRRGGFVENVWMDHCAAGEVVNVANIETQCYYQWRAFPDYELRYTPIRNIHVSGLDVRKAEVALLLAGDWHCRPKGLHFSDISVGAVLERFTDIRNCEDVTLENVRLREDDGTQKFCLNRKLPVTGKAAELSEGHRRAAAFFRRPDYADGTLADGVYDLGAGAVATVEEVVLSPYGEARTRVDPDHDRFYGLVRPGDNCQFKTGDYDQVMGLWHDEWAYFPAGCKFCDRLSIGERRKVRLATVVVKVSDGASAADELARENAQTAGRTVIAGKGNVQIALDRPDAQYRCGDEAAFAVTVMETDGRTKATSGLVSWTLDNYGAHVFGRGSADLAEENPFVVRGTLPYPGFLRVTVCDGCGRQLRRYSAAYEPEKIHTAVSRPDDFDAFWENAMAKLEKDVPLDPRLEQVPGWPKDGVNLQRVSFATSGGKRVYGVLSMPVDARQGPYPVRLHFPGAGPGLVLAHCRGDVRHVTLSMSSHYFPVPDTDEAVQAPYEAQEAEWRKIHGSNCARAYPVGGLTVSREAAHYYGIILGVNRAINWVAGRENVDPKRIFYTGESQGGAFGLILPAINRHITRAYAGVPAMADLLGCKADGRQSGWPRILEYETQKDPARLAKIEANARYFDAAFFAARIRVPIRMTVGYADESCAPHSVLAAYNAIPAKDKKLYHGIGGLHSSPNGPREEINAWLDDQ